MGAFVVSAAELHAQGEKAEGPGNFTSKRIQAAEGDLGQRPTEFTKSSKVSRGCRQSPPPSTLHPCPSCAVACLPAQLFARLQDAKEGGGAKGKPSKADRLTSYKL